MESLDKLNFYQVLGLNKDATEADIRKGYKKQSLKYHPDKNVGVTDPQVVNQTATNFQRVKLAYDTLSDPTQRNLYDKYGEKGLEVMNQYNNILDPEVLNYINSVLGSLSLVLCLAIIQLALITAQFDRSKHWNWNKVFVPIYVFDFLVFIGLIGYLLSSRNPNANESSDEESDGDLESLNLDLNAAESGSTPNAGSASAPSKKSRKRRRKARRKTLLKTFMNLARNLYVKLIIVALFAAVVVFQVLVATKLDSVTNNSSNLSNVPWTRIFIPYWIVEGFLVVLSLVRFTVTVAAGTHTRRKQPRTQTSSDGDFIVRKFYWYELVHLAYTFFYMPALRIALSILIPLKAENVYTRSWGLVFLPAFLIAGFSILNLVTDAARYRLKKHAIETFKSRTVEALKLDEKESRESNFENLPDNEKGYIQYLEAQNRELKAHIIVRLVAFIFVGGLYLISLGLLIKRIAVNQNDTPSVGVILVPIFIVVGFLLCCTCCCGLMLKASFESQAYQETGAQDAEADVGQRKVNSDRLIAD